MKALKVCGEPGCPRVTDGRRCVLHEAESVKRHRSPRASFYSSKKWRTTRMAYLRSHPWCNTPGCTNRATEVDHIVPLRDGGDPFSDANLNALCKKHHSEKTAREVWHRK